MRTILEDYSKNIKPVSINQVMKDKFLEMNVMTYALKYWNTLDYNQEASHCDNCDSPSHDLEQYKTTVWFCKPCIQEHK